MVTAVTESEVADIGDVFAQNDVLDLIAVSERARAYLGAAGSDLNAGDQLLVIEGVVRDFGYVVGNFNGLVLGDIYSDESFSRAVDIIDRAVNLGNSRGLAARTDIPGVSGYAAVCGRTCGYGQVRTVAYLF